MKLGIYVRTSSDWREASIAEQMRQCRQWAKEHGHRVVDVYRDAGVSGTLLERPELARAVVTRKGRLRQRGRDRAQPQGP